MPSVVVTSAGLAALLNAEQNGTLPVKITKFGLGTGNYTPTADKTALQSKFKEITALSGGAVGNNTAAQFCFHSGRHVLVAAAVNLLAFSVRLG